MLPLWGAPLPGWHRGETEGDRDILIGQVGHIDCDGPGDPSWPDLCCRARRGDRDSFSEGLSPVTGACQ
jgi:hypothetical protein